ncbi:cobalamin-binding protein [Pseudaeromonas paramecii]|uniref:Cobalamin-binding protein n=1 Tax=Pseudaeromonas paramecii TaxID=2138166 RepID=A0ABP8QDH5_9GAMM
MRITTTLSSLLFLLLSLPLPAAPQRIVSLTPHLTEQLFAIGAGAQLVAVDEASDWPAQTAQLPKVANFQSINLERLLALKPDLVVLWASGSERQVAQLQALQIPTLTVQSEHLADLPANLRQLGQATGHPDRADALAQQLTQQLNALRQQYQQQPPVRLLFQLWTPPLTTVAKGSWIQEAIELCGGDNPFADSPTPYPQINQEAVLQADPVLILTPQDASQLAIWQPWPNLAAVRRHQLVRINPDRLQRLTPRTLDGIRELCQVIADARAPHSH